MEDEIARVLEASISPDEATRVNAEQHLTQGGTMPGFGLALVRCALVRWRLLCWTALTDGDAPFRAAPMPLWDVSLQLVEQA